MQSATAYRNAETECERGRLSSISKTTPMRDGFTLCFCASAPAVQTEAAARYRTLQDRRERCRSERREEGREEAHPARVEGTHVRQLEAANLQFDGLVLRVHCARERPPVEVAPYRGSTGLNNYPLYNINCL